MSQARVRRRSSASGLGEDEAGDPVGAALGGERAHAREDVDAPALEGGEAPGIAGRFVLHLDQGHDVETSRQRQFGGGEGEVAAAEDHQPLPGEGVVAGEQRMQGLRPHHARLVGTGKGEIEVPGAGGEDQPVEAERPAARLVGEAEDPGGQRAHAGAVHPGPPGIRRQAHVDPELPGLAESRIGFEQALDEAFGRLHGIARPPAEMERHVHADQPGPHRVLVDQHHLRPGAWRPRSPRRSRRARRRR